METKTKRSFNTGVTSFLSLDSFNRKTRKIQLVKIKDLNYYCESPERDAQNLKEDMMNAIEKYLDLYYKNEK
jgi:hypothetical protein